MHISENDIFNFKETLSYNNYDLSIPKSSFTSENPSISFLIIVKNEERTISRCIDSILKKMDESDEIIIVDTGSNDKTLSIINSYVEHENVLIHSFIWNDDFSAARNYTINYAQKEWIFFIDADEYLEENSVLTLKKNICILGKYIKSDVLINPTIINTNDHIINGVTRIFKNNNLVSYHGIIHEYPKIESENFSVFSFESIVLYHDGYDENVINMEEKIERNIRLLEKMKEREEDIRWYYFYSRDGKYIWDDEKYEKTLLHIIKFMKKQKESDYYYSSVRDLIELYLNQGKTEEALYYISILKEMKIENSDIFYFETLLEWFKLKEKEEHLLNKVIQFRKTRRTIDYGALHSNYYHIDYLISRLLISLGSLNSGLNIQKKLKNKGIFDYTINVRELIDILDKEEK